MENTDPLSFLNLKLDQDTINKEIKQTIEEYNGLINRDTAIKLIAKKNGYLVLTKTKISEIKKGMRSVRLEAEVITFFPIYEREGENAFKCQRIMLKDDTGTIPLVFWNEDIEFLKNLSLGDKIEVIDAYENNGELIYAYRTKINMIDKKEATPLNELKEGVCSIKGRIVEIFPEYPYKKNGENKKMASFKLMQGKEQVRVIVWEKLEEFRNLNEGDIIRIESGWFKNGEVHVNEQARLIILEKVQRPNSIKGKITDIRFQNEELVILIEDKLLFFKDDQILNVLDISKSYKDIDLETILKLKQDALLDKEFYFDIIKQGDKEYGELVK